MNMPAATARMARITAKPAIKMNADRPVRMSQILNNTKPIFFCEFHADNLFFLMFIEETVYTHTTINIHRLHPTAGEFSSPPLGGG